MPSARPSLAVLALLLVFGSACDDDGGRSPDTSDGPTTLGDGDLEGDSSDTGTSNGSDTSGATSDATGETSSTTDGGPVACTSDDDCAEDEFCLVDECTFQTWLDCNSGWTVTVNATYRMVGAVEPELELDYDKCVAGDGQITDIVSLGYTMRPSLSADTASVTISMPTGVWADNPLILDGGSPAQIDWHEDNPSVPTKFRVSYDQASGELTRTEWETIGTTTLVGIVFDGTVIDGDVQADLVIEAHGAIDQG